MLSIVYWLAFLCVGVVAWFIARYAMGDDRPGSVLSYATLVTAVAYAAAWFRLTAEQSDAVARVAIWGGVLAPMLLVISVGAGLYALIRGEPGARWALAIPVGVGTAALAYLLLLWASLQRHL